MTTSPDAVKTKPFSADASLGDFSLHFPEPDEVKRLAECKTSWGREAFVRLWLTEGTPYAFRDCAAIYEDVRSWLGSRLEVCPKNITLMGSARLGFSLSPPPKYGQPFGEQSDFDLAVVSAEFFEGFRQAFFLWEQQYENGLVNPRHELERRYWDSNREFGHQNFPKGFFDAKKLPNLDEYPIVQQTNNAMWALIKKLEVTPNAPVPATASIRIYRDWKSLVRRVAFNVGWILRRLPV